MPKNLKFHAIALLSICAITMVVYSLTKQPEPAPVAAGPTGDRYIQIYSATWGANCDANVDTVLAERAAKPVEKNEKGEVVAPPKVEKAKKDNVLIPVSNACNGQMTCEIAPTSEKLGVEPIASCYKHLDIGYRCFSFDRMHTVTLEQSKSTTIDCNEPADSKTTAPVSGTQAN